VALGAGGCVALGLAFHAPGGFLVAWGALLPLLGLACLTSRRGFRWGVAAVALLHGPCLAPWLPRAARLYALNPIPLAIGVGLAWLLVGLALTAWVALARRLLGGGGPPAARAILVAAAWVAVEHARTLVHGVVPGSGPFYLLGYTQAAALPLVQVADATGVFGISFLVALVGTSAFLALRERGARRSLAVLAAATVAGALGYGVARLGDPPRGEPLRVGVVQVDLPSGVRWHAARYQPAFELYQKLTRRAAAAGARLVVWPENAVPVYFRHEAGIEAAVKAVSAQTQAFLLFGTPDFAGDPAAGVTQNTALLLDPEGSLVGRYVKRRPVPFAERLPLYGWLGGLYRKGRSSDMLAGDQAAPLAFRGGRPGPLICWEAAFPGLVRDSVRRGADLLVNLASESSFGSDDAREEMLRHASLRAVEFRRWLVRAANGGVSAVISPDGRIRERSRSGPTVLVHDVERLTGETFYARHGDLFAYACIVATAAGLLAGRPVRRAGVPA